MASKNLNNRFCHSALSSLGHFGRSQCLVYRRFSSSRIAKAANMTDAAQNYDQERWFGYTAKRWLWNESSQLAERYIRFDMSELIRVTGEALGSSTCTGIEKLPEGNFNKNFLLSFSDGKQAVARVPNPNAGRPHLSTASEVATMDFARTVLGIPVPKVLDWNSKASQNPVRAEYIIMEKVEGKMLLDVWDTLDGLQKSEVIKQVLDIERRFLSARFTKFGGLYYTENLAALPSPQLPLYQDENGVPQDLARFAIGPTNNRDFFDHGCADLEIDRGPWNTAEEYVRATAKREISHLRKFKNFPEPRGIFGGPGQYKPTVEGKISTLENYLKVSKYLLPRKKSLHDAVLWHNDLHTGNIFVDPNNVTKIIGIIDWQSSHISPLFLQARHPELVKYEGERLPPLEELAENIEHLKFGPPQGFDDWSAEEQEKNEKLRLDQSLYMLYEVDACKLNGDAYEAIKMQQTLGPRVCDMIGSISSDGEPLVNTMLVAAESKWEELRSLSGSVDDECPLSFTDEQKEKIDKDMELWVEGMELLAALRNKLGVWAGWDGLVDHENYDSWGKWVREVRKHFGRSMADKEEEIEEWDRVFPYPVDEESPRLPAKRPWLSRGYDAFRALFTKPAGS